MVMRNVHLLSFLCIVAACHFGATTASAEGRLPAERTPTVLVQSAETDPPQIGEPDYQTFAALAVTVDRADVSALKDLAERGVSLSAIPRDQAVMLLHRAARQGNAAIIDVLLDMGGDIEAADPRGHTPLMLALEARNVEAAEALKRRGANLSAKAHDGATAEYFASIIGANGFDLPQSAKAPTVALENADATLLLAAELGDFENVRFALAAGANPAARAKNKWSAMMLAALGSHREALTVIVDALNAKGSAGAMGDSLRSIADIDLDPIEAAIIGQGGPGKDHAKVERAIRYLASAVYGRKWGFGRQDRYMKATAKLGYENPDLARAAFGIRTGGFVIQPSLEPERPSHFLPELEYALPVGPAADQNGWRKVQRILREGGATDLQMTGRPDQETLKELIVYLGALIDFIEKRANEAALRATEELDLEPAAKRVGAYYGKLPTRTPYASYAGELYTSVQGDARPFGYVVEHHYEMKDDKRTDKFFINTFQFYRAIDDENDPLCRFSRNPKRATNYIVECKILDGTVRAQSGYENETYVSFRGKSGLPQARYDIPVK